MGGNIAHISHNRWWCTFFRAGVLCTIENVKFWPILGYFVVELRTFGVLFTGLNNVAVYQSLPI